MGGGTFNPAHYAAYTSTIASKPTAAVFTSRMLKDNLDPRGKIRESRDSPDNPASSPIIVGVDVTGSMGKLADTIVREGLGVLFTEILDRKPVTDPHVMFMAIGDADCSGHGRGDQAPLQVSQFEADNRIIEQLTDVWIEGGGGGNSCESYTLPWYFAATHTVHDSLLVRNKKGYLFTIGDEPINQVLSKEAIKRVVDDDVERDLHAEELLTMASRGYHVFHLLLVNDGHCGHSRGPTTKAWKDVLGQHLIEVDDYTKISEVIVSTIQVIEGEDKAAVAASWKDPGTSLVVKNAIKNLAVPGSSSKKVVRIS